MYWKKAPLLPLPSPIIIQISFSSFFLVTVWGECLNKSSLRKYCINYSHRCTLFCHTGATDSSGKPHGRGSLIFYSDDVFHGHFHHGAKHGKGNFLFSDGRCVPLQCTNLIKFFRVLSLCSYSPDDSALSGVWVNADLQGPGVYSNPDGSWLESFYRDGVLEGYAKELDPNGRLECEGTYENNLRRGIWKFYKPVSQFFRQLLLVLIKAKWQLVFLFALIQDGGCLFGSMDSNGTLSGKEIAYIYPDGETILVGNFYLGQMVEAWPGLLTFSGRRKSPRFAVDKHGAYLCLLHLRDSSLA